jgi:carbamoyltransferase
VVAYSYEPSLLPPHGGDITADGWDPLRTIYARTAPSFLRTSLPGLDPACVRFVPHHVAHAASAHMASPWRDSSVLVLDGRGEVASHLAGSSVGGDLEILHAQRLPHSLGLMYEEATEHLGFRRSSDEYKVMAMASYGKPAYLAEFRDLVYTTGDGGFRVEPIDWGSFAKRCRPEGEWTAEHADLASTVQVRLEEVLLELAGWLHGQTGGRDLTMAGGVALNCVANSRLLEQSPFERIWVQPAAGDAGGARRPPGVGRYRRGPPGHRNRHAVGRAVRPDPAERMGTTLRQQTHCVMGRPRGDPHGDRPDPGLLRITVDQVTDAIERLPSAARAGRRQLVGYDVVGKHRPC